jgi:serine/threonine-protein kinase
MAEEEQAFAATIADRPSMIARGSDTSIGLSMRATVLPRLVRVGEAVQSTESTQRFVPVRVLGSGGLGEVTLVHDNDIERQVALKRMIGEQSDELLFRFVQEIRTVGQLEHPNIPPVHDVGVDDDGRHYFVMRYIEGETLEAVIAKLAAGDAAYHAEYTWQRRAEVFLGVLHAMKYAHARGVLHRDLKPANIMIGPYGEVLLMDWGVAKRIGGTDVVSTEPPQTGAVFQTQAGSLVGTPAYMSPEQAVGSDRVDQRSDVYALAAVFYELLTLQHYLPGRTGVAEVLSAIVDDDHVAASYVPHAHQTPVPAELSWYVEKGLAKDPTARWQSVDEMIDELHLTIAGKFRVQCPVTFMKRIGVEAVRFTDRHPTLAMLGLGLLVGLVVFAIIALARMM